MHNPRGGPERRVRDACLEWPTATLPPALPPAPVLARQPRPVLPLHRGPRPALRRREDPRVPGEAQPDGSVGGAAVNSQKAEGRRQEAAKERLGGRLPTAYCLLPTAFCLLLTGCRQDMAMQPKYRKPDLASDFFPDGRSDRPIEADTVARGQLRDDRARYSGRNAPGPQVGAAKA